jgi:cold shock protein
LEQKDKHYSMSQITVKGVVKWFNSTKGYGFIQAEGQEKDIFVHYSGITGNGYRNLEEGDKVEFIITQGERGLQAQDVRKV